MSSLYLCKLVMRNKDIPIKIAFILALHPGWQLLSKCRKFIEWGKFLHLKLWLHNIKLNLNYSVFYLFIWIVILFCSFYVIDVFSFRRYYFLVPSYHFVSPESVQNIQHRSTTDLSKEYLLNAFGVEHHLYLLPYIDLVSSGKYCILLSWMLIDHIYTCLWLLIFFCRSCFPLMWAKKTVTFHANITKMM